MAKFKCPDCKEKFDLDTDDYEHGDYLSCPECNLELIVELQGERFKLKTAKEHDIDAEDEAGSFDEFYEED